MGKFRSLFGGGASNSSSTPAPAPPPPLPTRKDPEIGAARERQRLASLRQSGRRATIMTSAAGLDDEDTLGGSPIRRPTARAASVLGGGANA